MRKSFNPSNLNPGEPQGPARPAKPRILLVADVPDWIFARHCQMLERLLADEFQFTTSYRGLPYQEEDYDLIYPLEFNLIAPDQIKTPAKYITGIRSHLSWMYGDFPELITFLSTAFQRVHVVSRRLFEIFVPHLPGVARITHGVDTEFFTPRTRADQSGRRLRLGWAGNRLNESKQFDEFVAPLGQLPGVELVCCGYQDRRLNLDEMRSFYDSLDAYVCSSCTEGNNNSLMEAASMQRAIITTDSGTVPEYLRSGESALIVERQPRQFADAVIRLHDDPNLRVALGQKARAAVVAAFDWKAMAMEYRTLFRSALANGGAGESSGWTKPNASTNPSKAPGNGAEFQSRSSAAFTPMSIVYVSKEYGPVTGGGIGTYIANVCRAMAAAGHRVFLVTDCLTEAHKHLLPRGVEWVETEGSLPHQRGQFFSENQEYSYRVLNTLRGLGRKQKLDVVEFADFRAEGFATIRAKRLLNEFAGAKLVVKCHTPSSLLFEINESKSLSPGMLCNCEMEDYCVRYADLVTSPSLALASYFRERLGRADIRSCPYPLHLPRLPAPRTFGQRQTRTVRFLGSIQVRKGVDLFITAAIRILQADPDFRFEIYGLDGNENYFGQSYQSLLTARIPESCKDRITFAGSLPCDAVPGLLLKSCFCVFPSRWENWANVCLEAMSMGCVVIASNRGGMAEMIEHGKSGFLVDPTDVGQIVDLVLQHRTETPRLELISAAAHGRSWELADPARATARILGNYSVPIALQRWLNETARKVSVIIPCFNQGQYLEEAIQSVRISGYPNLEIVVVNDGSTDAISNAVFEAIVGVVKVRKANGGLSSARNAGIRAATGEYLLMLDADDKIHPDYISTAVRALDNNPGLSYLSCHAQNFGVYTNPYLPVGFVPALMPYVNTDGKCANVYRREVFAACGGYDEIMVAYEDWDFLLTLHERGLEGDVLPSEFLFYRRHRDSMVFTVADPQRARLIQYMILKHRKLLEKHSQIMVVVLAGLWKQTEITAEKLAEKVATLSAALAQENAPVRTKEVVRMLKRYGRRKLGWLRPSRFRAG